jgi:hypothetical protein
MNRIKEIIAAMNRRREDLWIEDDKTEFAELIVRECVATLTKLGNAYKGSEESEYEFGDFHYMQGILDSADVIKEHFGVKDERTNS